MSLAHHRPDSDAIASANPAVLAYVASVEALGDGGAQPRFELAYGPDRGQRIDVYSPPMAEGLPVLLFLHGGAWINGHLGWLRFMAAPVLVLPAVFVAATYRLAPRLRWPAQREDAAEVLRFVREHAHEWGGDPARIAIGGHSAGGQLAALTALEDDGALAACLTVSAPLDLAHGDVPLDSDAGRVYRYLLADPTHDREASPLTHAERARVPFHILWGELDSPYVIRAGREMAGRLDRACLRVTSVELPRASHFDTHLSLADGRSPWYDGLREALYSPAPALGA
ncbi:MAG: alpha/beta hydrolase fold domain-containing protein [Sphingomonadaceae bacterium]|nr:alpha/beta hydrolase fold domain-containing protein [Sphingomonadaceae bacterium]